MNTSANTAVEEQLFFDYASFVNPPNEYRSHPFYSLNDRLEAEELARQIKDFKQAGFGGFYLHSRGGLLTDYLSEDWWNMMAVAVDAANEVGLRPMFYDEDKWPSGFAGGLIPQLSEDYRAKCLARLDLQTAPPKGSVVLKKDGQYQYILYTAQFGYDIFNGTCYVDLYNPQAVKAFIESTHRPYFEKYKDRVKAGELVIFTDEPHIHARYFDRGTKHHGTLSYSPYLEKKFQQLYGYSLRDHLDQLFTERGNWREVRWHYHRAKALLFEESFTKQIADFCEEHGAQFTGHFLGEDGLEKVRDRIGNSSLHYRSMQLPGIDHLGLSIANRVLTPKYLSSVANQYGKRARLSELFGISGHNMNFQERKWIGGWHAVLGINHFCPHLTAYSMRGERKRDYPPTFSYHQPYWPYNKIIEDYLGRICHAATIGRYDPQVLVLSTLESEYIRGDEDKEFTDALMKVVETLQNQHIDYDLGDEEIIREVGAVNGNQLSIGEMNYRYVILPDMLTMRQSTLALLLRFKKNGGTILSTGRLPRLVDAKENKVAVEELKRAVIAIPETDLDVKVREYITPSLRITGDRSEEIWVQSRRSGEESFYLLYNNSNTSAITVDIRLPDGWKNPVLWDPARVGAYELSPKAGGAFTLTLVPAGFYWITTGALSRDVPVQPLIPLAENLKPVTTIRSPWQGERHDPNALLLDFAAYSTDGGQTYSEPEPVIGLWSRLADNNYQGELRLKFFATISDVPGYGALAMEQPQAFQRILVNGRPVAFSGGEQYYIGRSIKVRDISRLLKSGTNEIELHILFTAPDPLSPDPAKRYETELESLYLIGDFGVYADAMETVDQSRRNEAGDFIERPAYAADSYFIAGEPTQYTGNVALEGYPFYAGRFTLRNTFTLDQLDTGKRYFIDLSACEAIAIEVVINDQVVDTLSWAPYLADITSYVRQGNNTVQLHMVNSLRNIFGPHHHRGAELIKVGPNSFTGAGGFPDGRGERNWYELRKEKRDLAIWTDTYYHIPFGLLEEVSILME